MLPMISIPKEGDLYREVTIHGKTFRLLYGFYEDFEREGPLNEPMPVYPDFVKDPMYAPGGQPLVTAIQDACRFFLGRPGGDSCGDCSYFRKEEELFGLCHCPKNQNTQTGGGSL